MFFFPRDILLPLLFTSSSPSYRIPDGDYTLLFLTRELNCAAFNFFFFSCFITVRSLISSRSFSLPFLSNSFTHSLSLYRSFFFLLSFYFSHFARVRCKHPLANHRSHFHPIFPNLFREDPSSSCPSLFLRVSVRFKETTYRASSVSSRR